MDFTCETCNKSFNTDQQLQRHKNRRFKCKPMTNTEETLSFVCSCGKKYKYGSGLTRHRATCATHLKSTTTRALKNTITLNKYDELDISKLNWKYIEKTCSDCQTESKFFKVRCMNQTSDWSSFRLLCQHIINQVFFSTPQNMVFYISNLSCETAFMFNGETFDEIPHKELLDNIIDCVESVIDTVINKYHLHEHHPFVFILNYGNNKDRNEISTTSYNGMQENIKDFIIKMYKENKDDIKAVWRKVGLL